MQVRTTPLQTDRLLNLSSTTSKIIFIFCTAACLTSYIGPPTALLMGIAVAQFSGHPYQQLNNKATRWLLQISVVGLGFGMNFTSALEAGKQGVLFTIISISATLLFGTLLGRWFKSDKKTSYLISSGTAICGGSAIAAISPVIKAEERQISVALGCVFILNSFALFVFPVVGHYFNLSQTQFGLWCAIAIHDTSSVVGAAGKYGAQALEIATTVKLLRALWIIPVAFISAFVFKNKSRKINVPYFIGLFVIAMAANTYLPVVSTIGPYMVILAKSGLTLTLFLIGCGLSRKTIASIGFKPLLQAVILWAAISVSALLVVIHFR